MFKCQDQTSPSHFHYILDFLSAFCADEVQDKNGLNAYDYLPSSLRAGLKDSF
jgi:hypothetical protein